MPSMPVQDESISIIIYAPGPAGPGELHGSSNIPDLSVLPKYLFAAIVILQTVRDATFR